MKRFSLILCLMVFASLACETVAPSTPTLDPLQAAYLTITARPTLTIPPEYTQTPTATPSPVSLVPTPTLTHTASPTPSPSQTPSPSPTFTIPQDFRVDDPLDCLSESLDREQGVVTGVIDGQSIVVQIDGESYTVRYISVDTPVNESVGDRSTPDAASRNAALVLNKTVWLVKDVRDSDKFGRLMRYVLADDFFVNYELARGGYAYVYPYPPDTACYAALKYAEGQAKADELGLWSPSFEPTGTQVLIIAPTPTGGRIEPDIPCSCERDLYSCNDFDTQEDAQICFDFCWVVKDKDIHKLDRDFDGLACN